MRRSDHALRRFAAMHAAVLPVIKLMPELVYLRVVAPDGERLVYSLVHNRAHSNVAFLVGEDLRLEPEKDTLTVMPAITGSYPNFIFDVPLADIETFAGALAAVKDEAGLETVAQTWGLRRTRPDFWAVFHDSAPTWNTPIPSRAACSIWIGTGISEGCGGSGTPAGAS